MSDDNDKKGEESRAHNNPAVERFKKGKGTAAPPRQNGEHVQSEQPGEVPHASSLPQVDDDASSNSTDRQFENEHDAPAPPDRDAASRSASGQPVFYDNPLEAENSTKARSATTLVGRVKKAFQPHPDDGESTVFERLAAQGKAMAAGKNRERQAESLETEPGSSAEEETPIEAQSDREARKQRKARVKANKARQKPQESSVNDEQSGPRKGLGKAPRALAAVLVIGVVGTVAYKAGYEPPLLSTLFGSPSQPSLAGTTSTDESANESGLSGDAGGSTEDMPQLAENSSSEQGDSFRTQAKLKDLGLLYQSVTLPSGQMAM